MRPVHLHQSVPQRSKTVIIHLDDSGEFACLSAARPTAATLPSWPMIESVSAAYLADRRAREDGETP